ncbi:hypothetical protein S83_036107 [Arachis hypogaea]
MAEPTASVTLLIASWLTPSSLFIFVNLVVGTIAITSRFTSSHNNRIQEHELQHPFTRSPSLLQRVRSFRLTHQYTYDTTPSTAEPASSLSLNSFEHPRFWNESGPGAGPNQPTSGGHLLLPRSYWPSHRDPPLTTDTEPPHLSLSSSSASPSFPCPYPSATQNHRTFADHPTRLHTFTVSTPHLRDFTIAAPHLRRAQNLTSNHIAAGSPWLCARPTTSAKLSLPLSLVP